MESSTETTRVMLSDLLRELSPRWISGGSSADLASIGWICDDAGQAQPGDLVLIPAGSDVLADQIRQAFAGGAAAVGILGDGNLAQAAHPKPESGLADKPVFQLPAQPELRPIHQQLLRSLYSHRTAHLEHGVQIQTRLTQIAAHAEGLPGLVAAMREMTQHSILVQDKRLSPLASSPTAALRPIWEDLLESLGDFTQLPDTLRDRRQAGESGSVLFEILPGGLERAITPIVVGDVARGYLSVIAQGGELDRTDRLVAEQGALVCAVEMARAKAVRETEKRLHGDLLSALLHQTLSARDAALWAQNTGLDLEQHHAAVRLTWEGTAPSLRRLETLVNGEVSRQRLRAIVSPMSGEVICFCEIPRAAGRPVAALALAQEVIARAGEEHPETAVRCGIGAPAADLSHWHLSFRQAGQALDMARRLGERKPLYYMDLSVYRLLLQIEDHPDLRAFRQETLGPILAHENAVQLLATLEEYFAHKGNLSQTAEALFIHRNTLTYRLERISAISGLDLDNPDTRLAVQLALRIHRMLKSNAGKG